MPITTRSTPAGCAVMVTGLTALLYGLVAGFGVWKINRAVDPEKYQDLLSTLKWNCGVSIALGLILVVLGWRLSRTVRHFDVDDLD
jgi:hypothetical protein